MTYASKTRRPSFWFPVLCMTTLPLAHPGSALADEFSPFVAPADKALLVLIQNERPDRETTFVVFDADKKCVASVGGRRAELVPMKPGKHTLYVTAYNTRRIQLDLAAGRTYFIRIYARDRFATRVTEVTPVQRASDAFMRLKDWLDGTIVTHADDDQCVGRPLDKRRDRTQKKMMEANVDWKDGDDAFRAQYTLHKDDGLSVDELSML
ncbi:MAG: hypothetical protein WCE62_09755 [Polyangiales bacterium]